MGIKPEKTLSYPQALHKAVEMLARRPCSTAEIRRKIISLSDDAIAEQVISRLSREGLLNDHDFAQQWIHYRTGMRYGPRRIAMELRQKGVDEEIVQELLLAEDSGETLDTACDLIRKVLRTSSSGSDHQKLKRRAFSSLLRRGFPMDIVYKAWEAVWEQSGSGDNTAETD